MMTLTPKRIEQKADEAIKKAGQSVVAILDRRVVEMMLAEMRRLTAENERLAAEVERLQAGK